METINTINVIFSIIITSFIPAVYILFMRQSQTDKRISIAEVNLKNTNDGIREMITNLKVEMKEDFKELKDQLNLFIANENQFLKEFRSNRK